MAMARGHKVDNYACWLSNSRHNLTQSNRTRHLLMPRSYIQQYPTKGKPDENTRSRINYLSEAIRPDVALLSGERAVTTTGKKFTNSYLNAYFVACPDVAVLADRQQAIPARSSDDI
ncbi:MAG: hypothetical protein JST84_23460 [Acidobacteria bacterium]|nr:hypothetical protein [Acidobacteriota bacterium]